MELAMAEVAPRKIGFFVFRMEKNAAESYERLNE